MKIAIIGNGGGGKTTLSRRLAHTFKLPLTHVDTIQFLAGMKPRDREETIMILDNISAGEEWLIDGYGYMPAIERRFERADRIIFVDFPLWRHYWWCTKRQIKSYWSPRAELPSGCDESGILNTIHLFKVVWRVHKTLRPDLIQLCAREDLKNKVVWVRSLKQWRAVFNNQI